MHIPDGFLTPPVIVTTYAVSAGSIAVAWNSARNQFDEQTVPKIALTAAFIFVAQMINIPISGGTSGHLLGGFLAALLLGPAAGIFVMSLVLTVQMLVFQDGGLTALGANILNMGIIDAGGGYLLFLLLKSVLKKYFNRKFVLAGILFFSAWASVELGAVFCSAELGFSHFAPWKILLSLMLSVHFFVGLLEGVMTLFVYQAIRKIRPDLISLDHLT